ncbi:transposase [Salinibacter ruber]|uniref:transposase n=1 Tax=Salinibacter ruber TaxID=146919 RepID=UPI003C6E7266
MALTKRFLALVDPRDIHTFVADREFIGERWLGYLIGEKVPFSIRIRKNTNVGPEETPAWKLFSGLKVDQKPVLPGGKRGACWGTASTSAQPLRRRHEVHRARRRA